MVPLGTVAPDFTLRDVVSGNMLSIETLKSDKATVIMFICNHCPYVKHVQAGLTELAKDYQSKGASFIAINSNDVENYPDDSPDKMKIEAEDAGYTFPYLFDETQETAKLYNAACTPDFYIFDKDLKLAYRGQLDDSRPGNKVPVTGRDMRTALDLILDGKPAQAEQRPSAGCNIKWK